MIDFVWQFEEKIKHYIKNENICKVYIYQKSVNTVVSKQQFFQIGKLKIFTVNF